jgi:hypothetical protein
MTKEEYLKTPWQYENCDSRAIDACGLVFYYPARLTADDYFGHWYVNYKQGVQYSPKDVADWWHESLQTREEYLQLKNQTND